MTRFAAPQLNEELAILKGIRRIPRYTRQVEPAPPGVVGPQDAVPLAKRDGIRVAPSRWQLGQQISVAVEPTRSKRSKDVAHDGQRYS